MDAGDDRIPYYPTECDYYSRAQHNSLVIFDYQAGDVYDVASCLADISSLLLPPGTHEYALVTRELEELEEAKLQNEDGRNSWQGFGRAYDNLITASRQNYRLKWTTSKCNALIVGNLGSLLCSGKILHIYSILHESLASADLGCLVGIDTARCSSCKMSRPESPMVRENPENHDALHLPGVGLAGKVMYSLKRSSAICPQSALLMSFCDLRY